MQEEALDAEVTYYGLCNKCGAIRWIKEKSGIAHCTKCGHERRTPPSPRTLDMFWDSIWAT